MWYRTKKSVILFVCCAILSATGILLLPAARTAQAADPVKTYIVKQDTACTYYRFDYPTAVYAKGGAFTVADGTTAYTFAGDEITERAVPEDTEAIWLYNDAVVTLSATGVLRVGDAELGGGYSDFTVQGDTLYAACGREIQAFTLTDGDTPNAGNTVYTHARPVQKIAYGDNGVYFTAANARNRYQSDVFYVTEAAERQAVTCLVASDEILSMDGKKSGVVCLTRGNIVSLRRTDALLTVERKITGTDTVAVCVDKDNGNIYGITQQKSVFSLDPTLSVRSERLASEHDAIGFYRYNAGLTTRKQTIAVADERNGRVQLLTKEGAKLLAADLVFPKAVAVDYLGNLYVAHDGNKIDIFDSGYERIRTLTAPDDTVLTDLEIDSHNNVYALGSGGQVYKIAPGDGVFQTAESNVIAMTLSRNTDTLYAVNKQNAVFALGSAQTPLFTVPYAVSDLCADHDESLFVLVQNGERSDVLKYEKRGNAYALAHDVPTNWAAGCEPIYATKIEMNTTDDIALSNGDVRYTLAYGDLLLSDTGAHAVKAIAAVDFAVNKNFRPDSDPPAISDTPNRPSGGKSILYRVSSCDVYARAAERNRLTSLRDGMRVIVPDFDATAIFNLIIADNVAEGYDAKPIVGYVYTALIKEEHAPVPIPYEEAPSKTCYSYLSSMTVFKYPSFNAPELMQVDRNTQLTLCDFAYTDGTYGYTDNFPTATVWYRVQYEQNGNTYEGYVIADSISLRGETPDDRNIYPRTNAVIISKEKGSQIGALLYEKDDLGNIVPVTDTAFPLLDVGTQVEVVGAFDSSEPYTLIKYFHKGIGTVQFYVETANLKYDGVNKVVIVAVVLIILTVILGAILLARFLYIKRNRTKA